MAAEDADLFDEDEAPKVKSTRRSHARRSVGAEARREE